jgi:hypothetical protein
VAGGLPAGQDLTGQLVPATGYPYPNIAGPRQDEFTARLRAKCQDSGKQQPWSRRFGSGFSANINYLMEHQKEIECESNRGCLSVEMSEIDNRLGILLVNIICRTGAFVDANWLIDSRHENMPSCSLGPNWNRLLSWIDCDQELYKFLENMAEQAGYKQIGSPLPNRTIRPRRLYIIVSF